MNYKSITNDILILALDDSKTQLMHLTYLLESMNFLVVSFFNPLTALEYLKSKDCILPNIILSDITMPDINGFEFCNKVKSNPMTSNIPFIFLTSLSSEAHQCHGLDIGAVDYITKPYNKKLIEKRILLHYELNKTKEQLEDKIHAQSSELELVQNITIECIADLAENRDNETGKHIKRTKLYIKVIAEELQKRPEYINILTDHFLKSLYLSAPLHDIGKVGIPDSILLKPGKLTNEEFEIMKQHTTIGKKTLEIADKMMNHNSFLHFAIQMTESHHEKWDGSGYPNGLKGNEIPLIARLMAIADVYDALVNKRVYKEAMPHEKAVNIIKNGSGVFFDPVIVETFIKVSDKIKDISDKYSDSIKYDKVCDS